MSFKPVPTYIYVILQGTDTPQAIAAYLDSGDAILAVHRAITAAQEVGATFEEANDRSDTWTVTFPGGSTETIRIIEAEAKGSLAALARLSDVGMIETSQDEGTMKQ